MVALTIKEHVDEILNDDSVDVEYSIVFYDPLYGHARRVNYQGQEFDAVMSHFRELVENGRRPRMFKTTTSSYSVEVKP